jgi:hypothetical protein
MPEETIRMTWEQQAIKRFADTLRADGVILLGNYAEKYLGDATFEPLWAELDRRHHAVREPFQGYWQTSDYGYWEYLDGMPVRRP